MNRKYYLLIILIVTLCFAIMLLRHSDRSKPRQCADFHVTYATAKRFMMKEEIYTKFDDPTIANFKYSPFFAFLTAPFALFSLHQAGLILFVINFIFLPAIFILSKAIIVDHPLPKKDQILIYLLSLMCTFRYILAVLDSGQINILMNAFVIMSLYFVLKKKEGLAGAFIALSVMFKYTPFVFVPYFVMRRNWKVVLYTFVFMILYSLIPAVYVGLVKEAHYIHEWFPFLIKTSLDQGSLCDLKNQSFYSFILRYFTTGQYFCDKIVLTHFTYHQGLILAAALSVLIYSLILLRTSDSDSSEKRLIDYALLFVCMPLFNANAWTFNYVSLIFPFMLIFYYLIRTKFKDTITLTLTAFSFILGSIGTRGFINPQWHEWSQTLALTTVGALLLMIALFRLKFRRV